MDAGRARDTTFCQHARHTLLDKSASVENGHLQPQQVFTHATSSALDYHKIRRPEAPP